MGIIVFVLLVLPTFSFARLSPEEFKQVLSRTTNTHISSEQSVHPAAEPSTTSETVAHPGARTFLSKLSRAVEHTQRKKQLQNVPLVTKMVRTPIVLMHGLNEDASSLLVLSKWIRFAMPGVYVYSFEIGDRYDGFFTNMNRQTAAACDILQRNDRLKYGFHLVAIGHGALIGRAYIERCNAPPVFAFVSLAGPHMGVFRVPTLHDEHADFIMQGAAYEEWSQEYLSPAQYFRHPKKPSSFLKESVFLADINNERAVKNATYKANLASLEVMALVKFTHDEVVVPNESTWFGYFKPNSLDETQGMREWDLYKEDFIGLKDLDSRGRLKLIECEGAHQEFSRGWFYANILPLINSSIPVTFVPDTPHDEL